MTIENLYKYMNLNDIKYVQNNDSGDKYSLIVIKAKARKYIDIRGEGNMKFDTIRELKLGIILQALRFKLVYDCKSYADVIKLSKDEYDYKSLDKDLLLLYESYRQGRNQYKLNKSVINMPKFIQHIKQE